MKKLVILSGGVTVDIADHFSISASAYGGTGRRLKDKFLNHQDCKFDVNLLKSRMVDHEQYAFETYEELSTVVDELVQDMQVKVIVFNCAIPNFTADKIGGRIETSTVNFLLEFYKLDKLVNRIRKTRKDIFLVSFKTTLGADKFEMYNAGCKLLKESSSNLVLVNDRKNSYNMIVTPEESVYSYTNNRDAVLDELVQMTLDRSHLTFTRSTVVSHEGVKWSDERIPSNLRQVVDWCIDNSAYKEGYPGSGVTVGHFACKLDSTTFITSKRKTNFNKLNEVGMVLIKTDGPDTVLAYGGKPSVGGQSQRIIFSEHGGMDGIVHFHCSMKSDCINDIPIVSQKEAECGSHECGKRTSKGLKEFIVNGDKIKAVYLDQHGPNIVFSKHAKAENIIKFIQDNFDLKTKTNGFTYGSTIIEGAVQ